MLSGGNIQGMYAIIPTPASENASRWDAVNTVNLQETERLINALIADGSDGIIALGTTGECATLASADYRSFVECVVATAKRRVPVFVGATALGLHDVVARLRILRDIGADGNYYLHNMRFPDMTVQLTYVNNVGDDQADDE